jgi:succinoglycan biosynthesis transport protein ExoP
MKVSNVGGYEARLADVVRSARDAVRRRWLMLAAVAVAVTVIGVFLTLQIVPSYQGVARIQLDPSRNPLARTENEGQAQLASEAIETEVAVMGSQDLARLVVRRLGLVTDPEFNTGIALRSEQRPLNDSEKIDIVADAVRAKLAVSRDKLTYIIVMRFNSSDAVKAAKVANAFATGYLDIKVGSKIGTAERQSRWVESRMNELAADVRVADQNVAEYQAQSGIVRGAASAQGTITDQQVGPLSIQLASAESISAEARSKQNSAQQQVARGTLDAISEVRDSPTIQDLRRQRALLIRYGERHPDYIKVRDQAHVIDLAIREEADRVVRSLKADADAADARTASLRATMERLEDKQGANARASVIAASMQRDADSKHAAYDKLSQLGLDSRQAAQNSIAQAQIIDTAEAPQSPSWPNKPMLFLLSLLVGLAAGTATITAQELMVSGVRSVEDVESALDVPMLAAIPEVRKNKRPADLLISKPTSQFSEALRNARASILGVRTQARPKIIALTSALPSEGKTTTSLGLARTMAISGDRTIIVDTDVRRAQLRNIVTHPGDSPGIVDVLHGNATLDEAIQRTEIENLDQLLVQTPYFSSEDLFGNGQMQVLLNELAERYDAVILDLPPLIGLADGRFLAALADAVVLAIKWDSTPLKAVSMAAAWLRADGANLIGTMFTMVDQRSQHAGAYYYHSDKYSPYYQPA